MRIMGIDPGAHTGVCVIEVAEEAGQDKVLTAVELPWFEGLEDLIDEWKPALIILEDFQGSKRGANYYDPVRVIGAIQVLAGQKGIQLELQSPSVMFSTRSRARKLVSNRHQQSAVAHVLYWLRKWRSGHREVN